jgi:hypothetical protein
VGASRPINPPQAMLFYNTTTANLEFFDGAAWYAVQLKRIDQN